MSEPRLKDQSGAMLDISAILDRHAAVEASAGTGKTFTIEHIVLRILMDFPAVSLRNILLVTYTEKAAGELKERIRSRLQQKVVELSDAPAAARLRLELDDFDSASISTIHGFCNRVLMEFAFENARPLELEQGSDSATWTRLRNRIVRDEWTGIDPERMNAEGSKSIVVEALSGLDDIVRVASAMKEGDGLLPPYPRDLAEARSAGEIKAWTAAKLVEAVRDERQASSLVTFDDMISDVRAALRGAGDAGQALRERLRRRYMFAIVDEFQDTDPDQWDIFKAVFVEGDGPNRLIVVGDPKQAIYGFRGADLRTYLEARREITARGGRRLELDTNWRSSPDMIAGFNAMFHGSDWFRPVRKKTRGGGAAEVQVDGIDCPELHVPKPEKTGNLDSDRAARGAVVAVKINSPGETAKVDVDEARYRFARFVSKEIARLTRSGIVLPKRGDKNERPLGYDDICILIQKNDDFRLISRLLRAEGIPHAQYKQKRLYDCAEAQNTLVLLKALSRTGLRDRRRAVDSVLLTRFFLAGREPASMVEPAVREDVSRTLDSWRRMASARDWPSFFEVVSRDTGLFVREALEFDAERRLANWRQIFGELAGYADSGSLDLHGLTGRLQKLRDGAPEEEDSSMARLESELPKVSVLTIHAAKGLEFPVVFVAGGFSGPPSARWRRGYVGDRRYFSFEAGAPGLEVDDDQARLFYVALTRAMYRLYVPASWTPSRNMGAPVTGFMKAGVDALAARVELKGTVFSEVCCGGAGDSPGSVAVDSTGAWDDVETSSGTVLPDLLPGPRVDWLRRRMWIDSYSSLNGFARRSRFEVEGGPVSLDDDAIDEEPAGLFDETDAVAADGGGARPLLPAGRRTGQAFHDLMQEMALSKIGGDGKPVDFTDLAHAPDPATILESGLGALAIRAMKRNGVLPDGQKDTRGGAVDSAELQFAALVRAALCTRLGERPPLNFAMSEVSSRNTVGELEFHLDESEFGLAPGVAGWRSGLLNGFIDLVFMRDGLFWFLDWKTTSVRNPATGRPEWSEAAIERAMTEHGYMVQAHVYRIAMVRWLESAFGPGAQRLLGGGLFLFMRGMDGPGRGVWNSLQAFAGTGVEESRRMVGSLLERSAAATSGRWGR